VHDGLISTDELKCGIEFFVLRDRWDIVFEKTLQNIIFLKAVSMSVVPDIIAPIISNIVRIINDAYLFCIVNFSETCQHIIKVFFKVSTIHAAQSVTRITKRLKKKADNKHQLLYARLWSKNVHGLQDLVRSRLKKEDNEDICQMSASESSHTGCYTDNSSCSTSLSVAITPPLPSSLNESLSPTSPTLSNESVLINPVQFIPFSPSATKAKNALESNSFSEDSTTNKFKSNERHMEVVPTSDNFAKRKKDTMDTFLEETSKMMNKMAGTIQTVLLNRQTQALPNDEIALLSATIANSIRYVPKENRTKCLIKLLQVTEEFIKN
ncbi:hypothetical protein ALC62_10136, partial [Cyphomyrmex costatus]